MNTGNLRSRLSAVAVGIVCGVAVALTISGCLYQLNWQTKAKPMTASA